MPPKPRIAVVTPFLDKQHGTERCVAEQAEGLASNYEVHVYSSRVENVDLSKIVWHKVPGIRGPHLLGYCWWFVANHLWRWWDRTFRGLKYDLTFTPGINCFDADAIHVHIVFSEFLHQVAESLQLSKNPLSTWPRLIHRHLYYRLIIGLEKIIYSRKSTRIAAISNKTREDLARRWPRKDAIPIIYNGIDGERFNPDERQGRRARARDYMGFVPSDFVLLLIANDWKKKGLEFLLEAMGRLANPSLHLMVVGEDDAAPYTSNIERHKLSKQVSFLPIRPDVEVYYAAADAYVAPALEDAFGLPPLEAMGCGLPVVVSASCGVTEIISAGSDALVLNNPKDIGALAAVLSKLSNSPARCQDLGEKASRSAAHYTWRQNVTQIDALFREILPLNAVPQAAPSGALRPLLPLLRRSKIAVVSPFLDRRHGTERRASELVERFSRDYGFEIHIYSQRVRDIDGVEIFKRFMPTDLKLRRDAGTQEGNDNPVGAGRIIWHKLPRAPGPHLVNYIWWFASNHALRWWDRHFRDGAYDLVYTPGINCLDADVASVHIIFSEFYRLVKSDLKLSANPIRSWPRMIHRRIYYFLIIALENIVYAHRPPRLAVISRKTKDDVLHRWKRDDQIPVVYGGLDLLRFNPQRRIDSRPHARRELGLSDDLFVLLMIGNDWKKKGFETLLKAMGKLPIPQLQLIIAGQDSLVPYSNLMITYALADRLIFLPIRGDVEFYYAAADAYICPSLEDAFAYPPFEAMATGLPVVVSSQAGVSELVTDRVDGLVLPDPRDAETLTRLISELYSDPDLRARLGENAARTASQYTWERNAKQFHALFEEILHAKAAA